MSSSDSVSQSRRVEVDNFEPDEIRQIPSDSSSDSTDDGFYYSSHLTRRSRRDSSGSSEELALLPKIDPQDDYFLVYFIFYLLGMGTLLPWNFFISVNSFWDYKFRDVTGNSSAVWSDVELLARAPKTELQKEFTSYLAIASNIPNAIFVILNALVGQRVQLKYRIFISLGLVIGFFFIVLVFAETDSDAWQHEFMVLILVLVILINCCSAVFQGGLFGVAGKFPARYMGSVMAGQAMGGIFPAIVDIVVITANVEAKNTGFACFLIATLCLMASFLCFSWARRTAFFKFHAESGVQNAHHEAELALQISPSLLSVVQKTWQYCLTIYVTFATTLAVFPAVTVLVQSQFSEESPPKSWANLYFTPVTCFLLFNCGDYLGRILSNRLKWPGNTLTGKYAIVLASILRVGFIPLFVFCNGSPDLRSLPVWFHSDAVYILFMILFSISNGYLGSICMLHGPKSFSASDYQESSAMVLVACLVLGTSTGSFLSYPIVSLI